MQNETIVYPVRLNRYLYLTGVCSRREADRLIEKGEILVNGTKAVLGQKVTESDIVSLGKQASALPAQYAYYRYYKPVGVVSANPQGDEVDAVTDAELPKNFAPVGRLDKLSEGLMLLTNDGRIVHRLLDPQFAHPRTYRVTVDKYLKEGDLKRLARGVNIEGYLTKPAEAERLDETTFELTLTEGKRHQVRRMCAALGYQVERLKRTGIMHLSLDNLRPGKALALSHREKEQLYKTLNMLQ